MKSTAYCLSILSLSFQSLAPLTQAKCRDPSPAFPLPNLSPKDPLLIQTFDYISHSLNDLVSSDRYAKTSFSIEVTSSKRTLYSQHHTARDRGEDPRGVSTVDGDSVYRIASVTKLFTVLGVLYQHAAGNLSLDDPVGMYLEALDGEHEEKQKGHLPWHSITIRSLASQLSGIPRGESGSSFVFKVFVLGRDRCFGIVTVSVKASSAGADVSRYDQTLSPNPQLELIIFNSDILQEDAINDPSLAASLGLPPASHGGLPDCDQYSGYKNACTASTFFHQLHKQEPLFAPNQKSTYSNDAFSLLGLVLANVTGTGDYSEYIRTAIFDPLGMKHTTLEKPADATGVIPDLYNLWEADFGVSKPTGGIYATSSDMSIFLRYVLTHYNAITPAVNWLNPVSFADGMNSFYGVGIPPPGFLPSTPHECYTLVTASNLLTGTRCLGRYFAPRKYYRALDAQ